RRRARLAQERSASPAFSSIQRAPSNRSPKAFDARHELSRHSSDHRSVTLALLGRRRHESVNLLRSIRFRSVLDSKPDFKQGAALPRAWLEQRKGGAAVRAATRASVPPEVTPSSLDLSHPHRIGPH